MFLNLEQVQAELRSTGRSKFVINGELYQVRITTSGNLKVSTMLFRGETGFLPRSVRHSVISANLEGVLPGTTQMDLDLESGVVLLHASSAYKPRSTRIVVQAISEFVFLAEEWRDRLNDQGQKDLVTVAVR